MKKILSAVVVAALATIWMGCQQSTESTTLVSENTAAEAPGETPGETPAEESPATDAGSSEDTSSEFTLVTLNVPNMH